VAYPDFCEQEIYDYARCTVSRIAHGCRRVPIHWCAIRRELALKFFTVSSPKGIKSFDITLLINALPQGH